MAFALLNKIADEFQGRFPPAQWSASDTVGAQFAPILRQLMEKYQNPQEADNLSRVQKELDETKIIMVNLCSGLRNDQACVIFGNDVESIVSLSASYYRRVRDEPCGRAVDDSRTAQDDRVCIAARRETRRSRGQVRGVVHGIESVLPE